MNRMADTVEQERRIILKLLLPWQSVFHMHQSSCFSDNFLLDCKTSGSMLLILLMKTIGPENIVAYVSYNSSCIYMYVLSSCMSLCPSSSWKHTVLKNTCCTFSCVDVVTNVLLVVTCIIQIICPSVFLYVCLFILCLLMKTIHPVSSSQTNESPHLGVKMYRLVEYVGLFVPSAD